MKERLKKKKKKITKLRLFPVNINRISKNEYMNLMKERCNQEEKQENLPNPCMNSTVKIYELNSAIRNLKPKKAPRPDSISNNKLKHLGPIARKTLLEILNHS